MKKITCTRFLALLFTVLVCFCIVSTVESEEGTKAIELILDCSGSMNAVLPGGITRIDAAREAVSRVVKSLPPDIQIAFRAYGHQSPREKGDCNDTALLVPFGSLAKNKESIVSHSSRLQALGYTPITKTLQVSVADFPTNSTHEKMIILVSDGKETCAGDPCAAARAIQNAGVKLVIHTIGFAVDDATKFQLKCIAETTGGTYFDAENADQLEKVINKAAVREVDKIVIEKNGTGKLEVKNADLMGHMVIEAETGKEVGNVSAAIPAIELPAGLYNVTFGKATWKSVQVQDAKTTVLEPGILTITIPALIPPHEVIDSETRAVLGEISAAKNSLTLMPGLYDVSFGENLFWSNITLNAGSTITLNPGGVKVMLPEPTGNPVFTANNKEIGRITLASNYMPLPSGDYFITIHGQKTPFKIVEGKEVVFESKQN